MSNLAQFFVYVFDNTLANWHVHRCVWLGINETSELSKMFRARAEPIDLGKHNPAPVKKSFKIKPHFHIFLYRNTIL